MRAVRWMGVLALGMCVVASAGCEETETPEPPAPSPPIITERYSGVLNPNGALTFAFNVNGAGEITAQLTGLGEDDITVSLALGTASFGGSCQLVITNDNVARNGTVTGASSASGTLCVRIADVGKLSGVTSFEITLQHP